MVGESIVLEKKLVKTLILLNSELEATNLKNQLKDFPTQLEFFIATNVAQYNAIISSQQIDCFILDWNFEHFTITELVTKLRKSRYRQTPIAIVIDKKDVGIGKQYSTLKIDLLITRPFNFAEYQPQLMAVLNKKLGRIIPEDYSVLVLDDSQDILDIHIDHLKQLEHANYQTCTSIAQAKKLMKEKKFDLLLLDWNLGDGTCIDLIEFIRSKKENIDLNGALIMAVTGRDSAEDIITLLKYDVKDYIIKPFGLVEFEEKLIYARERHQKKA
jgi:DNA-binding response OmpR family regulator